VYLNYIGFQGTGFQVRDALHPYDLGALIKTQITNGNPGSRSIYNVGGGARNSMSLSELTSWCDDRFGKHVAVGDSRPRRFDIPWLVIDFGLANHKFGWTPSRSLSSILDEIADHARANPDWLSRCGVA
jgi:CDP-paratose 2-epimerase